MFYKMVIHKALEIMFPHNPLQIDADQKASIWIPEIVFVSISTSWSDDEIWGSDQSLSSIALGNK